MFSLDPIKYQYNNYFDILYAITPLFPPLLHICVSYVIDGGSDNDDEVVLSERASRISSSLFLPSNCIALGFNEGVVNIFDPVGSVFHLFGSHRAAVTTLCVMPLLNGEILLGSGSQDRTVKFWDVKTGECILTREYSYPSALAYLPSNQTLLIGTSQGAINICSVPNGDHIITIVQGDRHAFGIKSLFFKNDALFCCHNKLTVWENLSDFDQTRSYDIGCSRAVLLPNNLICHASDFSLAILQHESTLVEVDDKITSLAVINNQSVDSLCNPDTFDLQNSWYIASGHKSGKIMIWNSNLKLIRTIELGVYFIEHIASFPNGWLFFSCLRDIEVRTSSDIIILNYRI